LAYIKNIAGVEANVSHDDLAALSDAILQSSVNCPDTKATNEITKQLEQVMEAGDSCGGIIEFFIDGLPVGLGDPVYEKLEAKLAGAMLSLPASKGFEIGEGFSVAYMLGSMHNDAFTHDEKISQLTNHAGGTLGGISNGMPLIGRVAFKPTSSIKKSQNTVDTGGNASELNLPAGSKHDPCVAIRAVPIVEAMCALVMADALLLNRCAKL